jgi:DNA invertase Pin-like site-specific DNA recombinase
LDLCALTGTLIADADGVYSPADFNDRLLLGLKGMMSEAELHLIRARLDGGLRNKAERGELRLALPVGLDRDDEDASCCVRMSRFATRSSGCSRCGGGLARPGRW